MKLEDCFATVGPNPLLDAFGDVPARPHMRGGPGRALPVADPFHDWAPREFKDGTGRPLCLYLHVPFCRHRCSFCPFYINAGRKGFSGGYADLLRCEIATSAAALGSSRLWRDVDAVYFGGGTPSDLEPGDLAGVLHALSAAFCLRPDAEVTIEGRVRDFTPEKARTWLAVGANRFSLGVQSTDTRLRRSLGRLADRDEIRRTLDDLCATGAIVVVDLIFGLPGQTAESLESDVDFLATETGIAGLDLYELKQFPGSPMVTAIEAGRLKAPADRRGRALQYDAACRRLEAYGFEPFTLQHWRRRKDERSLYNRLAKGDTDILPFGSGAGGRLGRVNLSQHRDLTAYAQSIAANVKPAMGFADAPPTATGTFLSTLAAAIEARHIPPASRWPHPLRQEAETLVEQWTEAGLLELSPDVSMDCHRLTRAGAFWAPHLQSLITRWMAAQAPIRPA